MPSSEPTRNDQANTNIGHDYVNQYNNRDPGTTQPPHMTRGQVNQPWPNHNPHPPVCEVHSAPVPSDHTQLPPQRGLSYPEGSATGGHTHPRRDTYPQGHHPIQPGGQRGGKPTQFSQPPQGRLAVNTTHGALYHSHGNLNPGYSVPPTAYLQQPGTSPQRMQSGTNTQLPTQGATHPQQRMQSGTNTQQSTQGASYPQQPMQSGTNTQQPTQGTGHSQQPMQSGTNTQQPMQSGTNTQQPTQGATHPQHRMQSGTDTQLPTQGTGHSPIVLNNAYSQQPTQGATHSQQFTQGEANMYPSVAPPGTTQIAPSAQMSQPAVQPVQRLPPQHMSVSPVPQPNAGYEASGDYSQSQPLGSNAPSQPTSSQFSNPSESDQLPVRFVGLNYSPRSEENTDSPSGSPQPHSRPPAPSSSHLSSTPPQASRPSSAPPQTDPASSHDTTSGTPPPLGMSTSQSATGLPQQMEALTITDQPQQSRHVTHGQGAFHFGTPQNLSGHESSPASGGASSRVTEEVPADRDTNLQQIPGGHIGSSHGGQANLVTQQSQTQAVGHHSLTFCVAKTPVGTLPHSASGGQLDTPAQSLTNSTLPSFLSDVEIVARGGNHSGGAHPQGMTTSGGAHSPAVEQVSQSHPHHIDHTNFVLCPSGSPHQNVGTIGASGSHDLHSASGGQLDTPAQSLTNSTLPSFPSDVEIVASGGNMSESTLGSYSLDQQPLGMSETANHTVPSPGQTQVANPAYPSLANSTLPSLRSVPEVDRVTKPIGSTPAKDDQTDEEVREKPPTLSMNEPSNVAGSSQHSQETPQEDPGKHCIIIIHNARYILYQDIRPT